MDSSEETEAITKAFGKIILAYRTQNRFTRPQLAEGIGLSVPAIQKLEGGQGGGFRMESFVKMAEAMGKRPSDLLREVEAEIGLPKMDESTSTIKVLDHVLKVYVSTEAQKALMNAGLKSSHDTNELGQALEVAAAFLALNRDDKDEAELSILRKSPNRFNKKERARIGELLEKTTFKDA